MSNLRVGASAPDFKTTAYISGQDGFKEIGLQDYRGKWVCLYFYPLDFTFVCPTEIRAFGDAEGKFKEMNCQVLACSTDSVYSHKAWFERDLKDVKHPVLADNNHSISRNYGVLLEEQGIALQIGRAHV